MNGSRPGGGTPDAPGGSTASSSADLPPSRACAKKGVVRKRKEVMTQTEIDKAVRKEKSKLKRSLKAADLSAHKMKAFESIIDNVAVMKVKLDELKETIKEEEAIVEYDNGGGQKGTRENPAFKRYESLFKTFMMGMTKILEAIPDEKEEVAKAVIEEAKPQTVLELIANKHKDVS